jgi:hypothetical protein
MMSFLIIYINLYRDFKMDIDNFNIINDVFIDVYIKEIYENIKDKIGSLLSIELVNNMIYIYFEINHIIEYCILTVSFNHIMSEYLLSLILCNFSKKKFKKIYKKIIDVNTDSIRILNNISIISDYILVDFLLIHFN